MGHKAKKIFIRGFLQSFFIVVTLFGVAVLSYQAAMHYWGPAEEAVVAFKEQQVPEPITEASVDTISKNLIYCYDEETKEISKIVLEIFHCANKQMTYITIPVRSQFTMSDSLYRRLVPVHPAIPQIIKLSSITKYLESDTVFDYGVLMVEDLLGIKISYYTVIPKATYETIFEEGVGTPTAEDSSEGIEVDTLPVEVFAEEYRDFLQTITTAEELSTYMEETYATITSNLSLYNKMNYLESYCQTSLNNISFELIEGNDYNSGFVIDTKLATNRLEELTISNIQE